jgi:hypothetical protein
MPPAPAKVLISYSHDSRAHAHRVLELAERLRQDGVDAQVDQYVDGIPSEGWPRWVLNRLDWAEFVLVVCTETYYHRFRGHEGPGNGKGANWEGILITIEMYNAKARTTKFASVFFASQEEQFIPEPLRGHAQYLLNSEDNYTKLYAFLTRQAGFTPGALGSLKTLAHDSVKPLNFDSDVPAGQSALSNIPTLNPFFTGRGQILTELHDALAERGRAALIGLGGIGKTQTAVEYAHRHSAEYTHAFWATAASRETLLSSYVAFARMLKLPELEAKEQSVVVEAIQRWLNSNQGWLLILNNVDDLVIAREFIPMGDNGHVVLTKCLGRKLKRFF